MQQRIGLLEILYVLLILGGCSDNGSVKAPVPHGEIAVWNVNPSVIDADFNDGAFTISMETSFNRTYNYSRSAFYITDKDTITDTDFQGDRYTGRGVLVDQWQTDYPFNTLIKSFHYLSSSHEILRPDDTRVSLDGLTGQLYALGVSTIVMYSGMVDIAYESVQINFAGGAVQVQDWQQETINQTAFFNSAVAVDHQQQPHIAYYRLNALRYAVKKGDIWTDASVADINVNSECNPDIDVLPNGTVLIGYSEQLDSGSYRLSLARKNSDASDWGFIPIAEKTDYISNCSILVNGGTVYVLFFSGGKLYLASDQASPWMVSQVTSGADGDGAFVIDDRGTFHISYQSDHSLKIISGQIDDWDESVVIDAGIDTGYYSSIGCDSDGNLHISYYDRADAVLKYAANSSGRWRIKSLDNTVGYTDFLWSEPDTQVLIASDNTINIIYYRMAGGALMLAKPSEDEDLLYYIDRESDSGAWLSAFIDSGDNLHVAYYTVSDSGPRQLRYATDASVQAEDQ